jgi:hypothetical protein
MSNQETIASLLNARELLSQAQGALQSAGTSMEDAEGALAAAMGGGSAGRIQVVAGQVLRANMSTSDTIVELMSAQTAIDEILAILQQM